MYPGRNCSVRREQSRERRLRARMDGHSIAGGTEKHGHHEVNEKLADWRRPVLAMPNAL